MKIEIPYYILDGDGNSQLISPNPKAYIDDDDLKEVCGLR